MESMKNIKPAYATKLGTGVFAAAQPKYQCKYCGKTAYTPNSPSPWDMLPCAPNRKSHVWYKC